MKLTTKAGVACAALTLATCFASPVYAGGSFKDDYQPYMRDVSSGTGPCYFRADVGYSVSRDPSVKWPVNLIDNTTVPDPTYTYAGDAVTNTSMENSWFGEAGFGCGTGSRGFRAELMFGMRGSRDIDGEPAPFTVTDPAVPVVNVDDDPLHTSLRTYTMMANLYKDLGNYGGFTPYVGVGVGVAYNKLSEVYFTGNPALPNRIRGNSDLSLAWSLMAGVGYQLSERAILDVGYRFIDMGAIDSGRADNAFSVNPAVKLDDLRAHEIKIGLRYHFGGNS